MRYSNEVLQQEREYIGKPKGRLNGLAISGGGIRSAAFGMGVLQGLAASKILSKIHYLSTVSGGGYIGSSLTWFLERGLPDGSPATLEGNSFPFGRKFTRGKKIDKEDFHGNEILNFIRQHGNYLTPGKGLNLMSLLGVVIRSSFVSLLVYFSLLYLFMTALFHLRLYQSVLLISPQPELNSLLWAAAILGVLILALAVGFSVITFFNPPYRLLSRAQAYAGVSWTAVVVFALLEIVEPIVSYLEGWYAELVTGSSVSLGIIIGLYEQLKSKGDRSNGNSVLSNFRILIGALALLYGLLLLSYILVSDTQQPNQWWSWGLWWTLGSLLIVLVVGLSVNLNVFGFHRMYRDRLMETFTPNKINVRTNRWGPATDADSSVHGLLENMCRQNKTPYHIINTNLVTVSSDAAKYNGRGGDNFILSPLFCGSDATGWRTTNTYRKTRGGDGGMRLGTAMAISGAAVNPSAGPNGQGLTKSKVISVLLGLLNIQLGFWSDNPNPARTSWFRFPTFLGPGIFSHFVGKSLSETSGSILLTDGGHFENLGLYELIRRKLQLILVSDAGADPKVSFEDLANAIEKVRVDFGARIQFMNGWGLDGLIQGSLKGPKARKFDLAARGHAIAQITYHDGSEGILVLIKSTLTDNLPADIYGYKSNHPSYPDESTGDQFFNEVQFEAYRELGYQQTKGAVGSKGGEAG